MTAVEPLDRRRGFQDEDFAPILKGKAVLPNFEELPLERGIANIAAGACLLAVQGVRNARLPNGKHWARYFLNTTQGGSRDGTGYVMWYDHEVGHVGRFAICKHERRGGPGGNPRRGWHPGHCTKCGLVMTVDSGD